MSTRETISADRVAIREPVENEIDFVTDAVLRLLAELGATRLPARDDVAATARDLVGNRSAGVLLVAEDATGALVGVLSASAQKALHAGGSYLLLQDLWVSPESRGEAVGARLIDGLRNSARERGVRLVEVGLPSERFAGLESTRRFYGANGFRRVGDRMRIELT